MTLTALMSLPASSQARVSARQFLFSGRGPLRRAQIEWLRSRSDLRMPTQRLTEWREAWLHS